MVFWRSLFKGAASQELECRCRLSVVLSDGVFSPSPSFFEPLEA